MKNRLLLLLSFIPFIAGAQTVQVTGAMKNIMQRGDLSAKLTVDTIEKKNLFGLGPVAGLKGEMIILDGIVHTSTIADKKILSGINKMTDAAMLVYSYVPEWKRADTVVHIADYKSLEAFVTALAQQQGLSIPFVFKIEATASIEGHVIDWHEGEEHTMDNHKQFAGKINNDQASVQLLGFYSDKHHGVFTHHSTNMHIHALTKEGITSHLDEISITGKISVYLSTQ
jgi:acetolactate decarboxylase